MGMGVSSSMGWGMGIKCMGMGVKTWELEKRRTNLSPATVNSLLFLHTLCPKKVSPLNISQQPPQTCTDLNEILHTQDDIYFHKNPLFRLQDVQFF